MAIRPAQYRGVAELVRKNSLWDLDDTDLAIVLNALDRCGIETPEAKKGNYRCGVCGTNDLLGYMRCERPNCPDGRDR